MGLSSTIIYTSELILCSTICVPSATRHNIHMYPYNLHSPIKERDYATVFHSTFILRPCSFQSKPKPRIILVTRLKLNADYDYT